MDLKKEPEENCQKEENDFENSSESQQENFLTDQKVKKDPKGNFLFLSFKKSKNAKINQERSHQERNKRIKINKVQKVSM
jgi:hypothetical protein